MTKEDIVNITADVKKIRGEIADNGYEVANTKEMCNKLEKKVESNHKEVKTSFVPIREKAETN